MNKGNVNYLVGTVLLVTVISFFFYKSIFSELPINEALINISEIKELQVQLHRDLLRYRSNQIKQYDSLNQTLDAIDKNITDLSANSINSEEIGDDIIVNLKKSFRHQSILVEDFKTHHSILQNSLFYIFNVSSDLYSIKPKTQSKEQLRTTAELITLLLEYIKNPENRIANKVYPLIDSLNHNPDVNTKALINHSLMIIERLPAIDEILTRFNSLNIENQIISLQQTVSALRDKQNKNAQALNILLFICTLYLIFYILYIFITLRKSKNALSDSNERLNKEISLREKTEKALYQLVNIDKNSNTHNEEDRILFLLNALCNALDVEYAYLAKINTANMSLKILGLLDHGIFLSNLTYSLTDTPCEEVIKNGRLVHNRDFANYFSNCNEELLSGAASYIGIRLNDNKENITGMIAIASDHPIEDTTLAENILTIATSRATIELERQIEINKRHRYQHGLALIDDWIARLITEGYDRDAFFKNICRAAQEITKAQLVAFPVISDDEKQYHYLATYGLQSEELENSIRNVEDGGLCAWTILNNETLVIDDVTSDSRAQKELSKHFNIKSALLTPVTIKNKSYGAIAVFRAHHEFDDIDRQLITQFSQSVQMAIINMQLVSDMRSERERAEVTLHSIGDAVITTNVNGDIEYMNHVAELLTEWSLDDARNRAVQDVFRIEDLDTDEPLHDVVKSCLYDGITINKSILGLIGKSGTKKDIESSISPILKTSGEVEGVVIVFHDETQRRQLENTIKHLAVHDPLTDLLNRDAFEVELSDHVYDAKNNNREHALCYLEINNLSLIKDTADHSASDQCLIQVTSLIQSCIRSEDTLSRLAGNDFGLILKNCSQTSALKITDNIRKSVTGIAFTWNSHDYKVGISIGINPLNKNTQDAADAMRKADLSCYTAKDKGHNKIYVYEEEDSEIIRRQEESYWTARINEAIENDRFKLYAQPVVALIRKDPLRKHVEILARLLDENNYLIQPNAFIPAAERYNLMHLIDRKVIFETFAFIHKYSEKDKNITQYSINLSANSIDDEGFIDHIKDMVAKFSIDTKLICFEITETDTIKNLETTKALIKGLKTIGFRFALDNFGSGLFSFQYLKNLPIDYIKIDGRFVSNMINNNIDLAMVAAINEVSHIMGIKTIAEHVENDQIARKLRDLNVDYGQGYGIKQPRPIKKVLSFSDDKKSTSLKLIHNKP
ncbi:MAG: EAL domain-containing protein [Gammaproteobacteria bacterium]|nr:EAL domain-containing protein [Gammaproteobacteria bacterium]